MKLDTGIRTISLVIVPVTNQDRSIEYYERIGFENRVDTAFGEGLRWVEVYAPTGTTGIALAPPPGGTKVTAQPTGITLATADIDKTHAALRNSAVDVDDAVQRYGDGVPPMFWLRDPDGHTMIVVENTDAAGE